MEIDQSVSTADLVEIVACFCLMKKTDKILIRGVSRISFINYFYTIVFIFVYQLS